MEKVRAYAVEFNVQSGQMFGNYGLGDFTHKEFRKDLLGFLGMPGAGNVFFMNGLAVGAFHPTARNSQLFKALADILIGVNNDGLGHGNIRTLKQGHHLAAGALGNGAG